MKTYHIYLHIKLDSSEPFYVGKGLENGYRSKSKYYRTQFWKNIVNKHGYDIILLEEGLTKEEALEREIYWIKRIGRKDLGQGPLVNMTDGGDGKIGSKMSEETKIKISNKLKGIKRSDSFKKEISERQMGEKNHNYGKKHSLETRNKMKAAKK